MRAGGLSMILSGKELWSGLNLLIWKNLNVFQGACQKPGWVMAKLGGWKSWVVVFFLQFGLWHATFHSVVRDFATKTLGRKEPSPSLHGWCCLGYPAGLPWWQTPCDRCRNQLWSLNSKWSVWAKPTLDWCVSSLSLAGFQTGSVSRALWMFAGTTGCFA